MTPLTLVLRDSLICWIEKMPSEPNESDYESHFDFVTAQALFENLLRLVIESAPQVSNGAVFLDETLGHPKKAIFRTPKEFKGVIVHDRVPFEVTGWAIDAKRNVCHESDSPNDISCPKILDSEEMCCGNHLKWTYKLVPAEEPKEIKCKVNCDCIEKESAKQGIPSDQLKHGYPCLYHNNIDHYYKEAHGAREECSYESMIMCGSAECLHEGCEIKRKNMPEPLEPSQEELWNEFFEDAANARDSDKQSHLILARKWNLTKK